MKLKELLTEGVYRDIENMLDEWNTEIGGLHPAHRNGPKTNFFNTRRPMRMWTRGDGRKYKELASIRPVDWDDAELAELTTEIPLKNTVEVMNWAWNKLQETPGAKSFELSGEHGSDEFRPALLIGPYVFVRNAPRGQNPGTIGYGSKSILRNKDVWRSR